MHVNAMSLYPKTGLATWTHHYSRSGQCTHVHMYHMRHEHDTFLTDVLVKVTCYMYTTQGGKPSEKVLKMKMDIFRETYLRTLCSFMMEDSAVLSCKHDI